MHAMSISLLITVGSLALLRNLMREEISAFFIQEHLSYDLFLYFVDGKRKIFLILYKIILTERCTPSSRVIKGVKSQGDLFSSRD